MLNIILDILEANGVIFGENGNCKYQNKNCKWFPNNPYYLHSDSGTIDFKSIIKNNNNYKKAYQLYSDKLMKELFEKNDLNYQIQVNTQNLEMYPEHVSDFLNNYEVLVVSSPMATRKSNIISEVLSQASEKKLKCIFITNRVSLSEDISKKYKVQNYQNYNEYNTHLSVQFDSLHKFDVSKFDIVILDEITSLLNYTVSNHNLEYRKMNIVRLLSLMKHKKLVLADAFIMDYPYINERKTLGIYNKFREEHPVHIYKYKETFTKKIMADIRANRDISISSNEKGFLIDISKKLKMLKIPYIILTGDTSSEEREVIYNQFESNIKEKVILFSPTLTVGVSIFKKFDKHYHYDVSGTISPIDSIQMIRRVRNVNSIHLFLRAKGLHLSYNKNKILKGLTEFIEFDTFGNYKNTSEYGEKYAEITLNHNILKNSSKYALLYMLKMQFKNKPVLEEWK